MTCTTNSKGDKQKCGHEIYLSSFLEDKADLWVYHAFEGHQCLVLMQCNGIECHPYNFFNSLKRMRRYASG